MNTPRRPHAPLSFTLAILLSGVSLPSTAAAQSAEERLSALERALTDKKGELTAMEAEVHALRRELGGPTSAPVPPAMSDDTAGCSLDTLQGREAIFEDPNACTRPALAAPNLPASAGVPLPGRVLDRRGFTGILGASGDSTLATLKYTTTTTTRIFPKDFSYQRVRTRAYSFGGRATLDQGTKNGRIGTLDALTGGLALFAGFSQNYYPIEDRGVVLQRAEKAYKAGKEACEADAKKTKADPVIACAGQMLINWMFAGDEGAFARKDQVAAFNSAFWGSAQAVPQHGFGFEVEFARPVFDYYAFATKMVADPFNPGATKKVIAPELFPSDFAANSTKGDERYNLAGKVFGYRHWAMEGVLNGTTVIGSLAYKRDWSIPKEFKDAVICPIPTAGQTFMAPQSCTKINAAAPELDKGLIGGFEIRQRFNFFRFLPPIGVAPRYTYQFARERNAIEIPVYIASDDKGALTGGFRVAHEWGGTKRDGSDWENDTVFGVFFGATFDLNGSK
jgi:hypothetical protein